LHALLKSMNMKLNSPKPNAQMIPATGLAIETAPQIAPVAANHAYQAL